jgi:hypothetical protein
MADGRGEFYPPGRIAASTARYTQALFWGSKLLRVRQRSSERPGPWNDVLLMPNLTAPGYCQPHVYIDGVWIRELNPGESIADAAPIDELEAVEVYRWPFGVPARYSADQTCGVVLFWTKRR